MKLLLPFVLLLTFFFELSAQSNTFYVKGKHLLTPDSQQVILRGVNKMIFYNDRDGSNSYKEIAKTKANCVRIFWFTIGTANELDQTLSNAVDQEMISIPSVWEATGKWGAALEKCVDYWAQPEIVAIIKKHERHLILNIANEAGDGTQSIEDYKTTYLRAIAKLRRVGIRVPLMIDAAGWGRSEKYIFGTAADLLKADSLHNLIFGWHPWDANAPVSRIANAFQKANDENIAFVASEFAHKSVGCACCIPYKELIALAQEKQIGWLAWEWGPGNSDCTEMDMTTANTFESLHGWGLEVAVTDPNSISNTAIRPQIMKKKK